jgi:flagellar export protein FliJ
MAFHFSLESVLRVRRGQERNARLKLEAIVSEQSAARAKLEEITETGIVLKRRFQDELKNILKGSELQFEATRESNLELSRTWIRSRVAELEQQRLAQVKIFLDARRSREVLESVRLQKLELYRIESLRQEQQELDDLFLMRLQFQSINEKTNDILPGE